jgi:integral membrane protein (TIGR01906 family)
MSVVPWPVGLLFGLSLAVVITLAGPLLLFNPLFTSVLQARHGVPAAFDTSQAEVDRVTGEILGDLFVGGSFDAAFAEDAPLLNDRERSHMGDVSRLVQLLVGITLAALLVAVVTALLLRREPERQGRTMLIAAGAIGAVALVLAVVFAMAFDAAFLAFHQVFFPPGTYLFEPGSKLITLFPGGFWFDASLAAGGAIILTALAVAVIGLRRLRGAADARTTLI